ncbi:hypothetical protein GUJ93_ZPchr0010g9667 [Zizania palustris]|uniref:Uncharacterized protein n=3 Tax=Zizania palustris TaxID=103762 RepID=A0A8J6BLY1_ZIZPA|nr:hypothetical protein GUJ93_ZPchr0010g9667 [Zizania palustris]KAG8085018.1 hypothetical protein GUJ93_ZPchr0010g9667 [Zizania palustris]KAG8085019.1 hypothetical protein GUJ93_ZPchr0010g9667 [Zizania palustris]
MTAAAPSDRVRWLDGLLGASEPPSAMLGSRSLSPPTNSPGAFTMNSETYFSFKDAKNLWSLVQKQKTLAKKKRKWLQSMIPREDGLIHPIKRPKCLKDVYLAELDVRSDEVSCEKVIVNVEKCFGFQCDDYSHHIVQEGLRLFNLHKDRDGSLSPQGLADMHRTINKLSNEALQSVANIITHNRVNFEKTRPVMKKIMKDHLPQYLVNLGDKNDMSQLPHILTNPFSYRYDFVNFTTPISPELLSSINQVLDGLNGLTVQALVAVRRKLNGISFTPKFGFVHHVNRKMNLVTVIRKQCDNMISKLGEGGDLPNNLAKALSVVNLYRKSLKCMDISQAEFFPFSRKTVFLQNDVLNTIWSIQKLRSRELKLLRSILHEGSKDKMEFSTAVRRYLMDCLFECDEGDLPDEALRVVAFCNGMSVRQKIEPTEEQKNVEVEAVLNVSSNLRALAYHCTGGTTDGQLINLRNESQSDEQLMSVGCDGYSDDNDFVLTESYFDNFGHQLHKIDEACSCSIANPVDVSEHSLDAAGSSMNKPSMYEAVGANNVEMSRSSVGISEICDETASLAHKLVGKILKNMLLVENSEVNKLSGFYIDGASTSHGPQEEKNQNADIVIKSIEDVLPNLPKSCMDKIRRILHDN